VLLPCQVWLLVWLGEVPIVQSASLYSFPFCFVVVRNAAPIRSALNSVFTRGAALPRRQVHRCRGSGQPLTTPFAQLPLPSTPTPLPAPSCAPRRHQRLPLASTSSFLSCPSATTYAGPTCRRQAVESKGRPVNGGPAPAGRGCHRCHSATCSCGTTAAAQPARPTWQSFTLQLACTWAPAHRMLFCMWQFSPTTTPSISTLLITCRPGGRVGRSFGQGSG
jgi:hypothetical protein